MKTMGLVALSLVLGIQLLVFSVQTYVGKSFMPDEQLSPIRKPSSIEEFPKKGPIQELKYQILPNDFPWVEGTDFRSRIGLTDYE